MSLKMVTITGADDATDVNELQRLSQEFPFVEWGILVSEHDRVGRRFPSQRWIERLLYLHEVKPMQLSLHVCGALLQRLMRGNMAWPTLWLEKFGRMQLNFHGQRILCDARSWHSRLNEFGKPIIFQADGEHGEVYLANAITANVDAYALFDESHGAGVLPTEWRHPCVLNCAEETPSYKLQGYAGGLSHDNLRQELPRIHEAAKGTPYWIDMETHVRSADPDRLDLAKVETVLEIAKPFVT